MGWVSIFDPARLAELLGMPDGAEPVAILCLGPVPAFPDRPALEIDDWTHGRPLAEFVAENSWTATSFGRIWRSVGAAVGQQRHLPGVLDRDRDLTLLLRGEPGDPPGPDLAAIGDERPQYRDVLVVDLGHTEGLELVLTRPLDLVGCGPALLRGAGCHHQLAFRMPGSSPRCASSRVRLPGTEPELAQVPARSAVDRIAVADPDRAGIARHPLQLGLRRNTLHRIGIRLADQLFQFGAPLGVARHASRGVARSRRSWTSWPSAFFA